VIVDYFNRDFRKFLDECNVVYTKSLLLNIDTYYYDGIIDGMQ